MNRCILALLSCLSLLSASSQYPAGMFHYQLQLLRDGREVNRSVLYENDRVTLRIIPVNPENWNGEVWYVTVVGLVDNDQEKSTQLLMPTDKSGHAAVKLTNVPYEIGEIKISPPFGTESLLALFSRESFPPAAFDYLEGKTGRNEMLLLLKQSPLSVFYNRVKNGNILMSSVTFTSVPADRVKDANAAAVHSFFNADSTEILYSPVAAVAPKAENYPALRIVDPEIPLERASINKTDKPKLMLKGLVADKGHGVRNVSVNGVPARSLDLQYGYFEHPFELQPGMNTMAVSVENAGGFKKTQLLKLYYEAGKKAISQPSRNYLLIIGINNYRHHAKLRNAVKDASDFRDLMLSKFGYLKDNLIELYDDSATSENIYSTFGRLSKQMNENDRLLIYYAGHGVYDEDLQLGYWVPVNAAEGNQAQLIPNNMISRYIGAMKARKIFAIIDACYSGTLLDEGKRSTGYADKIREFKCRKVLASGRKELVSDGGGRNSPFATTLLHYLRSLDGPEILAGDLIDYVTKNVAKNEKQTPIGGALRDVNDEDGEFEFVVDKIMK